MYHVRILKRASRQLARLDKGVGRFVVKRINWLTTNLDNIEPEALTGELVGLYKFRARDYRIFYEILRDEQVIVIHEIGHRRKIYRKRR